MHHSSAHTLLAEADTVVICDTASWCTGSAIGNGAALIVKGCSERQGSQQPSEGPGQAIGRPEIRAEGAHQSMAGMALPTASILCDVGRPCNAQVLCENASISISAGVSKKSAVPYSLAGVDPGIHQNCNCFQQNKSAAGPR